MSGDRIPIKVICGPTATGKTAVGALAALHGNGEVICADSMQIYKGLSVGTAKPTVDEMLGVAHHLVDFLAASESYSAASFVRDADAAAKNIASRGKTPYIVGGTGLYISSLVDGIAFSDSAYDPEIRAALKRRLETDGSQSLYDELCAVDPVSAKGIHPNNSVRVMRALEYVMCTGSPISRQVEASRLVGSLYDAKIFVLDYSERSLLYAAIGKRVDRMVERGLVDEARVVFDNRADFGGVLQAIGYKEFFDYFEGKADLTSSVELLKQRTRNYAKRQLSWFRRMKDAVKIEVDKISLEQAAELINS